MDIDLYNITLIVVGALTWLVFVLGMAKFSKFYIQFIAYRKDQDINLTGMGSSVKKLQNSIAEMILEQRRTNKLLLELIESGKVGSTGSGTAAEAPPIEYQTPDDSPFIFHGNESQNPPEHDSRFIFHGNESQHQ